METWCYFSASSILGTLYSKRPSTTAAGGGYSGVVLGVSSGHFYLYVTFNGSTWGISNPSVCPFDVGVWQHIALVREGNVFTFYKNGINVFSATNASAIFDNGASVTVGADSDNTAFYSTCYMSNFRIVNGRSLYTSGFNPSISAAVPLQPLSPTQITSTVQSIPRNCVDFYTNGISIGSVYHNNVIGQALTLNDVGRGRGGGTWYHNGLIGEIIQTNTELPSAEVILVNRQLRNKWGE